LCQITAEIHLAAVDWSHEELEGAALDEEIEEEEEDDSDESNDDEDVDDALGLGEDRREAKKAEKDDVSGSTGADKDDDGGVEDLGGGSKPDNGVRIDDSKC
jgi:hypothetical protein